VSFLERAYAIEERSLGRDHPETADTLNALANAHNDSGQPVRAEEELRHALAVREAALAPTHPLVLYNLCNLAAALDDQGRAAEAVALDRRVLATAEKAFGPEHRTFGFMLLDAAARLGHLGLHAEASERLRRAGVVFTKLNGPASLENTFVRTTRADLLFAQGRWREAAALYEPAIPVLEQAHVTRNEFTVWVIHFGQAALALHQPARALPALERLATRFDDLRPDLRIAAEFTLARTLWDTGGDRRQAHELASHALAAVGPQATTRPDDVRQIARWLARH
jgi:tetratricopeptide (TPR) repeat protein